MNTINHQTTLCPGNQPDEETMGKIYERDAPKGVYWVQLSNGRRYLIVNNGPFAPCKRPCSIIHTISYNDAVAALEKSIEFPANFMQPSETMSRLVMSARPVWILRNSTRCLGRVDAWSGRVHGSKQ